MRSEEVPAPRPRPPVGLGPRELRWLAGVLLAVALIFLAGPAAYPNQAFFFFMMDYLILALGLNIIYGFTGYLPFGYTVFWGLGAYGIYIGTRLGLNEPLSFAFAIAVSFLLALALLPLFRLRSHYFAIASLAALMAVYYLVQSSALEPWTNGDKGAAIPQFYDPTLTYYVTFAFLVVSIVVTALIKYSRLGLALRAIRGNVLSAALDGVNVPMARSLAWVVSALMAAFAGAMYGWYIAFYYPDIFSVANDVYIIAFTIFGGAGTLLGPIVGTLVLNTVYFFLDVYFTNYLPLIFGALIVVLVLFLPNGLVDLISRRLGRRLP